MTERKRAGSRRSLAAAASTAKNTGRRNDDSTPAGQDHPQHPDQIEFPDAPTAPETPARRTRARKPAAKLTEPSGASQESGGVAPESPSRPKRAGAAAKRPSASDIAPEGTTPASGRRGSKYTAVLDDDTLDAFEQLTRVARRRLGRHVDKVEIFSTLVLLAADDVSLRDQLISAVGGRETHR
ncbi:hypothetical protein NH602_24850 [Pseudonocardia sp. McavD-2-B]|nr:hypothetical protein [Pseudonocardia sp. McavD-2-B]